MTTLTVVIAADGTILGSGPVPLPGIPGTIIFGDSITISAPQTVPLQPVASQQLAVTLNQQACTILLYFKQIMVPVESGLVTNPPTFGTITPLFMDLYMQPAGGGAPESVIGGVPCQANNLIVRDSYLGFVGDLAFVDTQPDPVLGPQDPQQSGLGTRWLLTYWPNLS